MADQKHDQGDDCGDHVHLGPPVGDDGIAYVRCLPDGTKKAGVLRPAKEGEPLYEGALSLEHCGPGPVFNVVDEFKRPAPPQERSGPAQVNSDAYRTGWDNLFGSKTVGQA